MLVDLSTATLIGGAAGGAATAILAGAWWLFSQIQGKHDTLREYIDLKARDLHERVDETHRDFVRRHEMQRVEGWLQKIDGRLDRLVDGKHGDE